MRATLSGSYVCARYVEPPGRQVVGRHGRADSRAALPRSSRRSVQYAREKLLESKGDGVISDRHLNYFTALAESFEPRFYHPDQVKWYGKVDADLDNVRTALQWALTAGNVECGLRLVNALHRYRGRSPRQRFPLRTTQRTVTPTTALFRGRIEDFDTGKDAYVWSAYSSLGSWQNCTMG